jgi:hypothetical protein
MKLLKKNNIMYEDNRYKSDLEIALHFILHLRQTNFPSTTVRVEAHLVHTT